MPILLITYTYNRDTSKADYDGLYAVIRSYRWTRLSESNWAIIADEPAKSVWRKLNRYIDPDDYLVMMKVWREFVEFKRSEGSCLVVATALSRAAY